MKTVAILCGGKSYEHEVSVITGLQVLEEIDRTLFAPIFIYFDTTNTAFWIKGAQSRADFYTHKRVPVNFCRYGEHACIEPQSWFESKQMIDLCYLAFHGGTGEAGQIQGLLETLDVPHTSSAQEGAVIAMNKALTKEVLQAHDIPTLPYVSIFSCDYKQNKAAQLAVVEKQFSYPVIIKPVHLGSSIAIEIARSAVELEKYLNVATRLDTEILIEPALEDFTEYNVAVRHGAAGIECSPVEEPKREKEILSFDDKYANGSKKTGGKRSGGGMELLDRTVPAAISEALHSQITAIARQIYTLTRQDGVVRIDFMYADNTLYCTEVNPIPGSMAFYLWEAAGEQFTEQVTISLTRALARAEAQIPLLPYKTDIVKKFIA